MLQRGLENTPALYSFFHSLNFIFLYVRKSLLFCPGVKAGAVLSWTVSAVLTLSTALGKRFVT